MKLAESWAYPGGDPCADFFGAYLKAFDPDVPEDARVLEIGCCEFDWITPALNCWPRMSIVGIDWRLGQDVLEPGLFGSESFDLIVAISAIEHVGLGHYGDPLHPDGDSVAMKHIYRWLKPGGWLLFDVPYDPTGYRVQGTKCRVYDDWALSERLGVDEDWRPPVFCEATNTKVLVEKPRKAVEPFHYVGLGWQKWA